MFKTDKPFGFAHKDLLWVYSNIRGDLVTISNDTSVYENTTNKKSKIFVLTSIKPYIMLASSNDKLRGRFIVIDTEEALHRIRAITLDADNIQVDYNAFLKSGLHYVKPRAKFKRSSFEKESNSLYKILTNRVMNQNKVFKKTYQTIHSELLNLVGKKTSKQKFARYKSYVSELLVRVVTNNLPYSDILNIRLGNDLIINKEGFRDVQRYCECASSIRTIQTFQDIIINKTPIDKALLENYGDAFTLNMMLSAWHPKSATFTENYSKARYKGLGLVNKDSLLSQDLVKRRNKTDIVSKKLKHTIRICKGMMIVDKLIKKLKLPEDEYRVVGAFVKHNKVNIVKEGIALHGIHSNKIFSVIGV